MKGGRAPQSREETKEVKQQSQIKVDKIDDKAKSDSRALLFKLLISHSHKELWGRFILFTFLLHLVSVILQCSVSYMGEGALP